MPAHNRRFSNAASLRGSVLYLGIIGPSKSNMCNNEVIDVTGDLSRTLQTLRYFDKERVLWVDAICVDHTNAFELCNQVLLMKEIYMNASQVVVLLSKTDTDRFQTLGVVGNHEMMKRYLEDNDFTTIQVLKTSNNDPILTRSNWNSKHQIPSLLSVKNIIQTDFNHLLYTLRCFALGLEAEIYEGSGGKLGHHSDAQFYNVYDAITSLCGKIFETLPLPTLVTSFDVTRLDSTGLCTVFVSLILIGWPRRHSDVPFVVKKDFKIAPFGPMESCVPVPIYSSEDAYTQPIYRFSWRDMSFKVSFGFSKLENEISNNRYCNFCGWAESVWVWTFDLDRRPDFPRLDFWLILVCSLFDTSEIPGVPIEACFRFRGYDLGYWPQKHPTTKPQCICAVCLYMSLFKIMMRH